MSRPILRWHEWGGVVWALGVTAALWFRADTVGMSWVMTGVSLAYGVALWLTRPGTRARWVTHVFSVWTLYFTSTPIIRALDLSERSDSLLAWDRMILGETPSVTVQGWFGPGFTAVLSGAYFFYQIYLHWVLFEAWRLNAERREQLTRVVIPPFFVGMGVYFFWPARVPGVAFPQLFTAPIPEHDVNQFFTEINDAGAATFDAFPSLHVLITLTLLAWDGRHHPRRFWLMIGPSLLMIVATLVLRYHYAVDLLASAALFLLFQWVLTRRINVYGGFGRKSG